MSSFSAQERKEASTFSAPFNMLVSFLLPPFGIACWLVYCVQPVDLLTSSFWFLWSTDNQVGIVGPHQFWHVEQRVKMLAIFCGIISVNQNSGLGAKVSDSLLLTVEIFVLQNSMYAVSEYSPA